MKILSVEQIRNIDQETIRREKISSHQLMEQAVHSFCRWFTSQYQNTQDDILIICGTGNNGGDGLGIARILKEKHYNINVLIVKIATIPTIDFEKNYDLINKPSKAIPIHFLVEGDPIPELAHYDLIIDALIGSGINRNFNEYWSIFIDHINNLPIPINSVDIPSGLFADTATSSSCIKATHTFSFELPKLAFFIPENENLIGQWFSSSIGLHKELIEQASAGHHLLHKKDISSLLKDRAKFSHKGNYGHALLVCGSKGSVGAAVLATKAALRTGAGKLSVLAPNCAYGILQSTVPEAQVLSDPHDFVLSTIPKDLPFDSIGVGCGLGQNAITTSALKELFKKAKAPLVIDADALNLVSKDTSLMKAIPAGSILTPHVKEFERLFGPSLNGFDRLHLLSEKAQELSCIIILKGAHTAIASTDGIIYFNNTGNPGMATAGSGDVLCGMLTSLLGQSYPPLVAAKLAVFIHGLSGDLCLKNQSHESMIASDIIDHLGQAFQEIK